MSRREILDKPKAEYRYKYIKDFQNTVITICGGTIVASLAFVSSLKERHTVWLAYVGLASLGLTILIHICLLFLSYIASGFMHDFLNAEEYGDSRVYSKNARSLKTIGKIISPLLIISLIFTPLGFATLFFFVVKNI